MNKVFVLHSSTAKGGAEYSLIEFLSNLSKFSIEVHIPFSLSSTLFGEKFDKPLHFHDIELSYLKKCHTLKSYIQTLFLLISCNLKLYRLIKKHKISILYCNTFRSLPYCLVTKLLRKTRIICHCRDNIPSQWIRYLINYNSDYRIAVSDHIKKQLLSQNKVKVVYNGINVAFFSQTKPTGWLHKSLNLHSNTKIIGNIGQIVSWKNQTDYIRVAKELIKKDNNLHFLIIGNVVDEIYYNQIKQLITNFNLISYFTLAGYVNDIRRYFPELDIIIHTAINEPFGRVLVEAAATSKPVIAYVSGGPSEIIKNNETGFLVEDGNIEKTTALAFKLLNDQCLRESIGKTAQKYAKKHFNSKKYATDIYNILIHDKCII